MLKISGPVAKGSQSLLIQRSYSYKSILLARLLNYLVAIPSYSEVLFLLSNDIKSEEDFDSRNPFLFRGPIPTEICKEFEKKLNSRNPFLFRGPIPTC